VVKCIAFLICIWETPGSDLDLENATLLDFFGALLRTSRKILNFPQIRPSYSSPISINLDTILSKLLQATLNNPKKLIYYKQIIYDGSQKFPPPGTTENMAHARIWRNPTRCKSIAQGTPNIFLQSHVCEWEGWRK